MQNHLDMYVHYSVSYHEMADLLRKGFEFVVSCQYLFFTLGTFFGIVID